MPKNRTTTDTTTTDDPAEAAQAEVDAAENAAKEPDGDVHNGTLVAPGSMEQARRNAGLEPTSGDYAADDE